MGSFIPTAWLDTNGILGSPPEVVQVGIIVSDLEHGARAFTALTGVEHWNVYTYDERFIPEMTFRGGPGKFAMRIALGGSSPVVELIEPLRGPSIYHEWLAENTEGLHHIAVEVESLDRGIEAANSAGLQVLQSGRGYGLDGDGGFAYLDTYEQAGILVELIEIPARRRPPEALWRARANSLKSNEESTECHRSRRPRSRRAPN